MAYLAIRVHHMMRELKSDRLIWPHPGMERQCNCRGLEINEMVGEAPPGHRIADERRVEVVAPIAVFGGETGDLHPLPLLDRQAVWTCLLIEVSEIVFLHLRQFENPLADQLLFPKRLVQVKDSASAKISISPTQGFFPAFSESAHHRASNQRIELAPIAMRANRWRHRLVVRVVRSPKIRGISEGQGSRPEMPVAMQ